MAKSSLRDGTEGTAYDAASRAKGRMGRVRDRARGLLKR